MVFLINGKPQQPAILGSFELVARLLSNPIPLDRTNGHYWPVRVRGFDNHFDWLLVPPNYPDLNPKTYKRSVRG